MNMPKNIIVHHSAVSYKKNPKQFDAINRFHTGKGWGMIGYHYLIEMDGGEEKGRDESQSGAHTKQKLMNYRSIGICLTGNFDIEEPTREQCKTLYSLLRRLQKIYDIPDKNVVPHRSYATYKSCWGSRLSNDIFGYLTLRINDIEEKPKWKKDLEVWAKKHIKEMDTLLDGDIYSVIALVKRAVEKSQKL